MHYAHTHMTNPTAQQIDQHLHDAADAGWELVTVTATSWTTHVANTDHYFYWRQP